MTPDFQWMLERIQDQDQDLRDWAHQLETDRSEPHNVALYYRPDIKKFETEDGEILWNPQILVPQWIIDQFRAQKSYIYVPIHGGNTIIELFWGTDRSQSLPPWFEEGVTG